MAHQLILGTLLGSTQPYTLNTQYAPPTDQPAATHVLYDEYEDPEVAALRKRLGTSNSIFGAGLLGVGIGAGVAAAGVAVIVIGIIPAIFGAPELLIAGVITTVVGVSIVAVAVPVAVAGALLGNVVLRQAGIPVSSTPGLLALGGIGVTLAGLALNSELGNTMTTTGLALTGIGSVWQVYLSNKAFKQYENEHTVPSQAALFIHPVVALDGYGAGMTVKF